MALGQNTLLRSYESIIALNNQYKIEIKIVKRLNVFLSFWLYIFLNNSKNTVKKEYRFSIFLIFKTDFRKK